MITWKTQLQQAISDPNELRSLLELPESSIPAVKTHFPLRVPQAFISRMQKGNPQDPLLLQTMIQSDEFDTVDGYVSDPLQESTTNPLPGLLHKYHGRVLIVLTGSCAINCRYCFRRAFPYSKNNALAHWESILNYIQQDDSISEVIFSGGDPLLIDDDALRLKIQELDLIPHVQTLRIHTRLPVVIPSRITDALVNTLSCSRLKNVMVLHINHANEIDDDLRKALQRFKKSTVLLNQAVLLKNINDSVEALEQLSRALFAADVLPYYLHQLDPVKGAHHFYVSPEKGLELMRVLRTRLPGYLIPRYVQEVPGELSKKPL